MNNSSRDIDLENQIDAYVKGRLTQDEAQKLWVQLLKKPDYIDLLETELYVKALIEQQAQPEAMEKPAPVYRLSRPWRWAAVAAFVAILLTSLHLLRDKEQAAIQQLTLSSIDMVEHLASPDIVRAGVLHLDEADSLLNSGFKLAISGQLGKALQDYERVAGNYPGHTRATAQAYLNIGIIRFNAGHTEQASAAFRNALQRVEDGQFLKEKTLWFLAHTYIRQDRLDSARETLRRVYDIDGAYRKAAGRLEKRLVQVTGEEEQ